MSKVSKASKVNQNAEKIVDGVSSTSLDNSNELNKFTIERMYTKQTLAKAAKVFNVDNNGQFVKPSFLTAMINWKLIIQILLELLIKYMDTAKTDKLLWESNKK